MYNYLYNPCHHVLISGGVRSNAMWSVGGLYKYTDIIFHLDRSISKYIVHKIENNKNWLGFSKRKIKAGRYTFTIKGENTTFGEMDIKVRGPHLSSISSYSTSDLVCTDLYFIQWIMDDYDFSGFGEYHEDLCALIDMYLNSIMKKLIKCFHKQTAEGVKGAKENCNRIAYAYFAFATFKNAIAHGSYEGLKIVKIKSTKEAVYMFEDIVNEYNNTSLQHARRLYNEQDEKREQNNLADIVKAAVNCIKK